MLGFQMTRPQDNLEAKDSRVKVGTTADWLYRINQASVVSNLEEGLLSPELAQALATALFSMQKDEHEGKIAPAQTYIAFEPEMLNRAGMNASVIHIGRSSQDILATVNAGLNKERIIKILDGIHLVVSALYDLAKREEDTVVPAYTNGVQALPNRYAHYILAFCSAFLREAERLEQCLSRYNICPMGSGVLNGSGWPLNRDRMAELLGFDSPAVNAFDAGQIAGNTLPLELSQCTASLMALVNSFLADFSVQYSQASPWVLLCLNGSTYISSAMPQKRNPGYVNDCRRDAAVVTAQTQSWLLRAQNLSTGMPDMRDDLLIAELCRDAFQVLRTFSTIVSGIRINKERALNEINSDWSCTQEIADQLTKNGMDFRTSHDFASFFVTFAKKEGLTPLNVNFEQVLEQWEAFFEQKNLSLRPFPLTESAFFSAIDPTQIVESRRTLGGPQKSEIQRMLNNTQGLIQKLDELIEGFLTSQAQTWRELNNRMEDLC